MRSARQDGFTLIELLIVVGVIGAIAAIAVPGLIKARITTEEASAIGSLRTVNSAQASYSSGSGGGGYADRLETLATGCGASGVPFISPDLAIDPALKSGYVVTLRSAEDASTAAPDCNGVDTHTGFYVTAVPLMPGISGHRGFASAGGAIFYDASGAAPTEAEMVPGGGGLALR